MAIVKKNLFCELPFTKLILNSWGDVSMCCHQVTQLGRLSEETNILDLWNSPVAKEIREKTKQTNLKKYGVKNFSQTKEFKEKWGYIYNPDFIGIGGYEDWDMSQRILQMGNQ